MIRPVVLVPAAALATAVSLSGARYTGDAPRLDSGGQTRCEHRAERAARISASTSDRLKVRAGSGSLRVEGVPRLKEIRVRAAACSSREEWLEALQLDIRRGDDEVRVSTLYPDDDNGDWGDRYARLELVVEVPMEPGAGAWMDARIDDTSGPIELSGLGDTRIDDNSGEIEARDINGGLQVDDGSGEIRASDVAGDVEIDDGSGQVVIRDVGGSVMLIDGSGTLDVRDVEGSVVIRDDGSGDIRVVEVGGGFRVDEDGSGDIRHSQVGGRVELPPRR